MIGTVPVLAGLPRVSLDELNLSAARLRRTDRKYVLDLRAAAEVLAELPSGCRILGIDDATTFGYRSTYLDTAALDSYLLAARSRPHRFKVRLREYLSSGETWLEVKTRDGGQTVKERIPRAADGDPAVLAPAETAFVTDCLERGGVRGIRPESLSPVLETTYRRSTLLAPDGESRATVDEELVWQGHGDRLPLPRLVIIETKTDGRPSQVDRCLWRHGHRPARISKYATGLARLRGNLPANRWHRTLNRHFTTN